MIAKGQNKIIRFKQEQDWAVIPSNTEVSELRRVNASFDVIKNLLQSNEINSSYQVKNFVTGVKNAKGMILGELTPGAYSHLISHALASSYSWDTDELLITLKVEESPTSGLYRITRQSGSWLTSNIRSGLVIRLDGTVLDSGTKNNNLFVCSVSALVIDVYVLNKSSLVIQDFIIGNRCYIAGAVTYAQKTGHVDKSFSFEECYTDIGHYELYSGNKIQSMQIDLQSSNEYPSITFDLVGCDLVRKDSTPYFTSSSRNTNRAVSNKNSAIFIDGQPIGLVTAFNLVANRDLGLNNAVGLSTAIAITENMLKVNGSFTVYFTDASLKQRYYDEVACAMSVVLAESNYKGSPFVCVTLPKVIIKSRSKNDNASSLFDTYEFTAVLGVSIADESSPVATDPYFDNVSLLLHMDGENEGTVFVDSSSSPKTVISQGNAQTSDSQVKFGETSLYLDGIGDALTVLPSVDFDFGIGDFTIEGFFYRTGHGSGDRFLVDRGNGNQFLLRWNSSGNLQVWILSTLVCAYTFDFSVGNWYHIAVTRSSGAVKLFVNGTNVATGVSFVDMVGSTAPVYIGAYNAGSGDNYNGYIDELRITKGVARYTTNFTPPTAAFPDSGTYTGPSASYINTVLSIQDSAAVVDDSFVPEITDPYFANVELLLHMDGDNGGTVFMDSSSRNRTLVSASSYTSTVNSVFGGSSGFFPSIQTAGPLKVLGSNNLSLGAGDFTIECFIFNNGNLPTGYTAGIVFWGNVTSDQFYWGVDSVNFNASGKGDTAHNLPLNQWSHIACVRSSGTMRFFVNGLQVGTSWTRLTDFLPRVDHPKIGRYDTDNRGLNSFIDELRITKGIARYTASFTPPTEPFPNSGP